MKVIFRIFVIVLVLGIAIALGIMVWSAETSSNFEELEENSAGPINIDLNDMDAVLARIQSEEAPKTIRILGIGNSWTVNDFRWIYSMLEDAGYNPVIGVAYLGASSLMDQYFGVFDEQYTYERSDYDQIVHSTYQYQKYSVDEGRVLTPAQEEYDDGAAGIGVTLESIVSDEPWDFIVFQQQARYAGLAIGWTDPENTDTFVDVNGKTVTLSWDINDFVDTVLDMLPEGSDTPRVGLSIPWAPANGTDDSAMTAFYNNYNNGIVPETNEERTALYEHIHESLQTMGVWASEYMGDRCDYVCNPGLAIYNARQNEYLSVFGWKMQRARDNTHLAAGIPMYVAGMAIIHEVLGVTHMDFNWYPTASTTSYEEDDEGETVQTDVTATKEIAWIARVCGEVDW